MDLMQLKTMQWLGIVGALASVVGLLASDRLFWAAVIFGVVVVLVVAELQKSRLSVMFSGLSRFHATFYLHAPYRITVCGMKARPALARCHSRNGLRALEDAGRWTFHPGSLAASGSAQRTAR
jgi:hypothetical protein